MLTSEIVAKVMTEGVSSPDALSVINERYLRANAKARWRKTAAALTTTVAGQSNYSLDVAVVDIDYIRIGSTEYIPAGQEQIWGIQSGRLNLVGTGGLFAADFASGDPEVELYPAPSATGTDIEAIRTVDPALLTVSPETTPIFPADLHGPILVDGSLATIRARTDERIQSASYFEQIYADAVEDLRRRANRRVGGNRPRRAQLVGRDF